MPDLQATAPSKVRQFYRTHHSRDPQHLDERIAQIRAAQPLTEDSGIIGALSLMVRSLAQQLQPLLDSTAEFDRLIQTLFQQHPDHSLFDSFPGAGAALAPRLLAAVASDRQSFETAGQIKSFSGIAPIPRKRGRCRVILFLQPALNLSVKPFTSGPV